MIKLFYYELKRLLWNKFFLGILVVTGFYGWQVLTQTTLLGVAHTAPFSAWSFGDYLSRTMPLLWIGSLFFLTFFTSEAERRTEALTAVTPIEPWRYAVSRYAAAAVGTSLLCTEVLILAAVFYNRYFGWNAWENLILPAIITFVPSLIFALGSGWLLGKWKPWLLYVWMPLPIVLSILPLPQYLSLWKGTFFAEYPLTLKLLDPDFSLPNSVWLLQCLLALIGILFFSFCIRRKQGPK